MKRVKKKKSKEKMITGDVAFDRGKIIAKHTSPSERVALQKAMESWMLRKPTGVNVQISLNDMHDTVVTRDVAYVVFENMKATTRLYDGGIISDGLFGFRHKFTADLLRTLCASEHPAVQWDFMEQSFILDDRIREDGEHWEDGLS